MKYPLNMRGKKTAWTRLLLALYIATVVVAATSVAPTAISTPGPDQSSLKVTPKISVANVSETFVIDVVVNVTDPPGAGTGLWGFQYRLQWNSSILNVTSIQYHVPPTWTMPFVVANTTLDLDGDGVNETHSLSITTLAGTPFTGVMSLCTYNFSVTGLGSCALDILLEDPSIDDILVDDTATEIPHETVDGYFSNIDPIPIFTYSPDRPIVNEAVIFNASDSYSPAIPPYPIVNYTWNFDDGTITSTNQTVITHTYTAFRSYTVTLTVTDNQNNTGTALQTITVRGYPEAFFTLKAFFISPDRLLVDQDIRLDASGSKANGGTIVSYAWDLGDGRTPPPTDEPTLNREGYKTSGTYTVTLTVTDSEDLSDTYWATIKVLAKPVANFSYSPAKPTADETITFNASASYDPDGSIVSYFWNFGDGTNGTGVTITHAYTALGTYTVILTVTDNDTLSDTTKQLVSAKLISNISISASPTTIVFGKNTTISGSITPTQGKVNVTIYYRLAGEVTWNKLTTVLTNENSQYSYSWKPPAVGTYEVKASWLGDADCWDAESSIATVKVQEAAPPYILYVAVIIVIAIAAAIAVYFLKIRKS